MCILHGLHLMATVALSIYVYTSLQVLYSSCRHLLIVQVMSSHVKNYFTMMDVCLVSCETLLLTCTLMQLPIASHRYIQVLYIYILSIVAALELQIYLGGKLIWTLMYFTVYF